MNHNCFLSAEINIIDVASVANLFFVLIRLKSKFPIAILFTCTLDFKKPINFFYIYGYFIVGYFGEYFYFE